MTRAELLELLDVERHTPPPRGRNSLEGRPVDPGPPPVRAGDELAPYGFEPDTDLTTARRRRDLVAAVGDEADTRGVHAS